jgi:hypothetical protein
MSMKWISAVMTSIPTCSCPVDICIDDSYTNMFMSMKWISAVMTVIPACSCPVDICGDDSYTNTFISDGYLQ